MARLGPIAMPQVHRLQGVNNGSVVFDGQPEPQPFPWGLGSSLVAAGAGAKPVAPPRRPSSQDRCGKRLSEVIPLSVMGWLPQHRAVQQGSRVSAHRRSRANAEHVTSGRIRPPGGDAPGGRSTRCGNRTTTMHPDQAESNQCSHARVPTSGLDLSLIWMPARSRLTTERSCWTAEPAGAPRWTGLGPAGPLGRNGAPRSWPPRPARAGRQGPHRPSPSQLAQFFVTLGRYFVT